MPGTKHVSRVSKEEEEEEAILWLQLAYTVHVMLFQMIQFCTFTLVLSDVRAQCPVWPFL